MGEERESFSSLMCKRVRKEERERAWSDNRYMRVCGLLLGSSSGVNNKTTTAAQRENSTVVYRVSAKSAQLLRIIVYYRKSIEIARYHLLTFVQS